MSLIKPAHIAQADWDKMSKRKRQAAVSEPEAPKPEPTEAQKAASAFNLQLMDNGANLWKSADGSKKRVYINDMLDADGKFVTVYWDCIEQRWSDEQLGKLALEKMADGIRFDA